MDIKVLKGRTNEIRLLSSVSLTLTAKIVY